MLHKESFRKRGKIIITSIAIILCVLITPILFFSNSSLYFNSRFAALNIYENFPNTDAGKLNQKFAQILDYMNGRVSELDSDFYSEMDILHMRDVRNLNIIAIIICSICSCWITYVLYLKDIKNLIIATYYAGTTLLLGFTSILTAIFISFDSVFIKFHQLLFNNDYWQLDPLSSNLIKFLPSQIFNEIFIIVSLSIIITSLIMVFLSKHIKKHAG